MLIENPTNTFLTKSRRETKLKILMTCTLHKTKSALSLSYSNEIDIFFYTFPLLVV